MPQNSFWVSILYAKPHEVIGPSGAVIRVPSHARSISPIK
jgi:hypothetical protein